MRAIKSVDVGSMMLYGAVLAAIITLTYGVFYWSMGWAFGAQSWWIDMNLGNWTEYTFSSLLTVFWQMIVNGIGGAIVGLIVGVFYNAAASSMGGIKIELDK